MRCLAFVLTLIPLLACAPLALAGEPPVPIEGKLLVTGPGVAYFLQGSSNNLTPAPSIFSDGQGDVSPLGNQVAYYVASDWGPGYWTAEIWKAGLDGSDPVNLTALAGLGGINCTPFWSPDGTQIAFNHCDPIEGLWPCEVGFSTWVMNCDGTDAYRVTPEGTPCGWVSSWAPNGYRLLANAGDPWYLLQRVSFTIDRDGTDLQEVPNISANADWSPDGSKFASRWRVSDVVDGEPGVWRQLRLVNADGTDPQILVQHFIPDSVVEALFPGDPYNQEQLRVWVGPSNPEWSPTGDRIAFLAALPFDPHGPSHWNQLEVWIYDLACDDLTKITDNLDCEFVVSWNGDNTFPEDPEVTVDNTTVTFDEVADDGLTTIIRDDDPPDLPSGYQFCEEFYEVSTTADISGPISICMTYNDEDVPTGVAEEDLTLLHWVEEGDYWEDITTSRDADTNTICGETDSLSLFTLSAPRPLFKDVPYSGYGPGGADPYWAYSEIKACVAAGVVAGYPDGSYQPDWDVTRAQMAVFIARAIAIPTGEEGVQAWEAPETPTFPDVADYSWCYKHVEMLCEKGIVEGYPDGFYRPTTWVSRDQMAVYMARAVADPLGEEGLAGYTPPAEASFLDADAEHWAYKHIEYCAENSIVAGYADGFYRPSKLVTRDQMAVYVARAFGLM